MLLLCVLNRHNKGHSVYKIDIFGVETRENGGIVSLGEK